MSTKKPNRKCARPGCGGVLPEKATSWQKFCNGIECRHARSLSAARGAKKASPSPVTGRRSSVSMVERHCESWQTEEDVPERGCMNMLPAGTPYARRFCSTCGPARSARSRKAASARQHAGDRSLTNFQHVVSRVVDRQVAQRIAASHGEEIA